VQPGSSEQHDALALTTVPTRPNGMYRRRIRGFGAIAALAILFAAGNAFA